MTDEENNKSALKGQTFVAGNFSSDCRSVCTEN